MSRAKVATLYRRLIESPAYKRWPVSMGEAWTVWAIWRVVDCGHGPVK